jgi:hypothetical protein
LSTKILKVNKEPVSPELVKQTDQAPAQPNWWVLLYGQNTELKIPINRMPGEIKVY